MTNPLKKIFKPTVPITTAAIHMGASSQAVEVVKELIVAILSTSAGDTVKIEAIRAASASTTSNGHVIQNCNFQMKD